MLHVAIWAATWTMLTLAFSTQATSREKLCSERLPESIWQSLYPVLYHTCHFKREALQWKVNWSSWVYLTISLPWPFLHHTCHFKREALQWRLPESIWQSLYPVLYHTCHFRREALEWKVTWVYLTISLSCSLPHMPLQERSSAVKG